MRREEVGIKVGGARLSHFLGLEITTVLLLLLLISTSHRGYKATALFIGLI